MTHAASKTHFLKSTYNPIKDCLAAHYEQPILFTDNQEMLATGDDDNKGDDELFAVWLTDKRHLALFPARTIVRYPHRPKSGRHCKQDFNMWRT